MDPKQFGGDEWAAVRAKFPGAFKAKGGKRQRHNPDVPIVVDPNVRTVLAIDPSIASLGYAILWNDNGVIRRVDSGCWHPSQKKDAPDKWLQLLGFIRAKAKSGCVARLDAAAVELPALHLGRSAQFSTAGMVSYGRAVGMVHACLLSEVGRVFTPSVRQWKATASKQATIAKVGLRLGYKTASDDEADAIGLALFILDLAVDANRRSRMTA